jgi:hypothetical protein
MRYGLLALSLLLSGGAALAQDPANGSRRSWDQMRQDRSRSLPVPSGQSRDARELDQLLRLRERSQERSQRLRQPSQPSRPANTNNSRKNKVVTQ